MVTEKAKRVLSQLTEEETKNTVDTLVYLKAREMAKTGLEAGVNESILSLSESEIDNYVENVATETVNFLDDKISFEEAYGLAAVTAEAKIDWYQTKEMEGR